MKNWKVKSIITLLCAICLIMPSFGAEETFVSRVQGSQIVAGKSLTTQDDKYNFMASNPLGANFWGTTFDVNKVDNTIALSLDPYNRSLLTGDFEITLELQVSYDEWNFNAAIPSFTSKTLPSNIFLKIENKASDAKAPQIEKSVYKFPGGHRLKVTVVGITSTVPLPSALTLEAFVSVERYYRLANTAGISPGLITNSGVFVNNRKELEVRWPYVAGAEEYELEWTHMDNYSTENAPIATPNIRKAANQIPFSRVDFATNSTRISTSNTFYRIPLLYERGYILYRVRAVGRNRNATFTKNLYAVWSDQTTSFDYSSVEQFPNKYEITSGNEFNANLNWQSSISFAEEGKNKASVSFFDGSLRNRQTVTKMNTQDEVIAGETIYDDQGRPMVQVLPAPVQSDANPSFKPSLNKNNAGNPFSQQDVIAPTSGSNTCVSPAAPMNNTSGASQYYSPQNANQANENQYIPDAEGYPYTQTIYTPDNTGRIKAQSGVGPTHKIGSDHETKYFYTGPPNAFDVNRLFGNEVGQVERYKKNLVVDANGQVSVSYLDAQGRVIATALAGASPEQLDALPSNASAPKVQDFMQSKSASTDRVSGSSKTFTTTFGVTTKDEWIFDYNIQANKFVQQCADLGLGEVSKCYDCVLDLQIVITDDCGKNYLVNIPGFNTASNTAQVGQLIAAQVQAQNCTPLADHTGPSLGFTNVASDGQLPVGSYTIKRVLAANQEAMDAYLKDYLESSNCILKLDDFVTDETNLNVSGKCDDGCTECLEDLGSYDQYNFALNPNCQECLTPEEYEERLKSCQDICQSSAVDCENYETAMLGDLTPFGQYAGVSLEIEDDPATAGIDEEVALYVYNPADVVNFPLSIFNEQNNLPQKKWFAGAGPNGANLLPNWRFPYYKKSDGTVLHYYLDEKGQRAYITINKVGSTYLPAVVDENKVETVYDANGRLISYRTEPQNIADVAFVIANWEDSWSESMLIYHPEYCYLQYCQANSGSYDFDNTWIEAETVDAAPVGFIDPIGILKDNLSGVTTWANAFQDDAPNTRIDPYLNPSLNSTYSPNDHEYMRMRMLKTLAKNNNVSITDNVSNFYNVWQVAYISTYCPMYEETPGAVSSCDQSACAQVFNNPSVLIPMFATDTKLWEMLRSIYYGAKRELVDRRATQFAIKNGCYNGCVGNDKYDKYADGFFDAQYKEVQMESYITPQLSAFWQEVSLRAEPGTLAYIYATYILRLQQKLQRVVTVQKEYFHSQTVNPEQPCNNTNAALYLNSQKVFIRTSDEIKEMNQATNSCMPVPVSTSVYALDPTELSALQGPVCPDLNKRMTEDAMNTNAFKLYEECGQCVITKNLETFLDEVAATTQNTPPGLGLASPNLQVNCSPNGLSSFTLDLENKFQFAKGSAGQTQIGNIEWKANINGDRLTANLTKTVNGIPEATQLVFAKKASYNFTNPETGIPQAFSFTWDKLNNICCMEATDNTSIIVPAEGLSGYRFKAMAFVTISFDGGVSERVEKITIEGYTQRIPLTCPPPVICETLPVATDLSNLFNTMAYSSASFEGVDINGNPTGIIVPATTSKFTNIDFTIDQNISVYQTGNLPYENAISVPLLNALGAINSLPPTATSPVTIGATWTMVGTENENIKTFILGLTGAESEYIGQYPFELEIPQADFAAGATFSNIKRFTLLASDRSTNDPARRFTARALVDVNGTLRYIDIKGYSPNLMIGQCKTATLPTRKTTTSGQ